MIVQLTHVGWFGVCPVYLGDLDTEAPTVVERHWLLSPLMAFSQAMYGIVFWCTEVMGREPPGWPLLITGENPRDMTIDMPEVAE